MQFSSSDPMVFGAVVLFVVVPLLLLLFAFLLVAAFIGARISRRRDAEWRAKAQQLGLTASGRWPDVEMTGSLDGADVKIKHWTVRRRTGGVKRRTVISYMTRAEVRVKKPLGGLTLGRSTFTSDVLDALFGGRDIQVGDAEFDAMFVVRGPDEAAAKAALDARARKALMDAHKLADGLGIVDNSVFYATSGPFDGSRVRGVLSDLAACARAIDG